MTAQQIFGTALRIFALWLLVNSISYLVSIPGILRHNPGGQGVDYSIYTGVFMVALALALWFFLLWIAHRLVPRTKFENNVNLQPLQAAQVGSALIGLWFFAKGLLSVVWLLIAFVTTNSPGSAFDNLPSDDKARFVYALIEVFLALVLMLRASTFARLVACEEKVPAP